MIGWDYTSRPATESDQPGNYYCGCRYVSGESHCVHHGDPAQHYPQPKKDEEVAA